MTTTNAQRVIALAPGSLPRSLPAAQRPSTAAASILPKAGTLAVNSGARDLALARLNKVVEAEKKLPLQPGSETRVYVQPGAAKGTIVMYHGFTAGTWQFELLARQAYAEGYNVYIPRLPGHGLRDANGMEDPSKLLNGGNWKDYQTFAESTYQDIKGLGGPISVVGLSVGGNIALEAAEAHHDITRVVAYAPFLKPPGAAKWILELVHLLDYPTFGLAGKLLSKVPWGWGKECEQQTASGERPGHSKFSLGNIYAATQLGRKLVNHAPDLQATVQYFTTAVDDAADEKTIKKLHDRAGGDPRNGWYHYPTAEKVPHPMVHPYEDKGAGQTPDLYAMTMRFLTTGLPIDRN